jgi:hypothetical protein
MDDTQKSRVRLSHWIEHNVEHLKGYEEVAQLLEKLGSTDAAHRIRQGMRYMESANQEFEKAIALLPAPDAEKGEGQESDHADHDHHHDHAHNHAHPTGRHHKH